MSSAKKYNRIGLAPAQAAGGDVEFSVDENWVRYQTGTVPGIGTALTAFSIPPNLRRRHVWMGGKAYASDLAGSVYFLRGRFVFTFGNQTVGELPFSDVGPGQLGIDINPLAPQIIASYPGGGSIGNLQSGYSSAQPSLFYRGGSGFGTAWAQVELPCLTVNCVADKLSVWLDDYRENAGTNWFIFGARVLSEKP